jgi:hypothetical protein
VPNRVMGRQACDLIGLGHAKVICECRVGDGPLQLLPAVAGLFDCANILVKQDNLGPAFESILFSYEEEVLLDSDPLADRLLFMMSTPIAVDVIEISLKISVIQLVDPTMM